MRKSIRILAPAAVAAAAALPLAMPTIGSAATWHPYQASLQPITVNHSHASGTATVKLSGDSAKVTMHVSGLAAGAPHAQHFHIGAKGTCPTSADAKTHNGHKSITVTDAAPEYGKIGTSLTTKGDTGPKSALAVKRFSTAPGGAEHYSRTITVSQKVAQNIRDGKAVVVVHGVDYNGNGKLDGVLGKSELDPKLPAEATDPAACGPLKAMPAGGMATGGGSTAGIEHPALFGAGGGLIIVAAALGAVSVRRRRTATSGDRQV